jgi:hypothetical protein
MQNILRFALLIGKFVILPLGILMLLGATYLYFDTRAWLKRSVEAQGSVIEMGPVRDRETGSLTFAPLIRFQTTDGKTVDALVVRSFWAATCMRQLGAQREVCDRQCIVLGRLD